jgi:vacuolar protein sorting-associated protein 52
MWLDRLAGQSSASGSSTPQPGSRPYSPLPRRSSSNLSPYVTSQRPGHTPRASTLSLVSNDSSSSLLASSQRPNGSNLKQSTTIEDASTSIEALEKLLGTSTVNQISQSTISGRITDADLGLDFDFKGRSLREFALGTDDDAKPANAHRSQTVDECTSSYNMVPSATLTISWQMRERKRNTKACIDQ